MRKKLRSLARFFHPKRLKRLLRKNVTCSIDAQIADLNKRADALVKVMPFLPTALDRRNAFIEISDLRDKAYRLALSNHKK